MKNNTLAITWWRCNVSDIVMREGMVTIGGVTMKGNDVKIIDGKVFIDGVEVDIDLNQDKKTNSQATETTGFFRGLFRKLLP